MHISVGLNTWFSQLVRHTRITDSMENFEARCSKTFMDFLLHGYEREKLVSKFSQFIAKHRTKVAKYGISSDADYIAFVQRVFHR